VVSSGISTPFGELFRAPGQITHVLLTRAPLYSSLRTFSLDLHVLGTPPAFVLSQDQTLQLKSSNPLPGTLAGSVARCDSYVVRHSQERGIPHSVVGLLFSFQRPSHVPGSGPMSLARTLTVAESRRQPCSVKGGGYVADLPVAVKWKFRHEFGVHLPAAGRRSIVSTTHLSRRRADASRPGSLAGARRPEGRLVPPGST
jgi:hypothetical protein